jgi:penicillin-binding protein 2
MAQFFAALAGDGSMPAPHLLAAPVDAEGSAGRGLETDLRLDGETLQALREGLARVTAEGGTAHAAAAHLQQWKLYGKTGTAQNAQDPARPHAWFTGFAGPADGDPEIAIAVIVEHGEHGSTVAAPIAAKVVEKWRMENEK